MARQFSKIDALQVTLILLGHGKQGLAGGPARGQKLGEQGYSKATGSKAYKFESLS